MARVLTRPFSDFDDWTESTTGRISETRGCLVASVWLAELERRGCSSLHELPFRALFADPQAYARAIEVGWLHVPPMLERLTPIGPLEVDYPEARALAQEQLEAMIRARILRRLRERAIEALLAPTTTHQESMYAEA
jgi:hypothetical protein